MGVPGSSRLQVHKGFDQGTEKERKLWTGSQGGAKGDGERGVAGRRGRPVWTSPGQTSVAPAAGCLPCLERALCDALISIQVCAPPGRPQHTACLTNSRVGRGLCVAAGGQHPQVPSVSFGRRVSAPVSGPPSPVTQHLYPLSGSHCPSLCLFAHLPLQTWHSLPPTCRPALQLFGLPVVRKDRPETLPWGLAAASWRGLCSSDLSRVLPCSRAAASRGVWTFSSHKRPGFGPQTSALPRPSALLFLLPRLLAPQVTLSCKALWW